MRIGFEVEVEQSTNTTDSIPGLRTMSDGSLRNGVEYVSDVLPDTTYASWLYGYLHNHIEGVYTERCGVHIHVDFTRTSTQGLLEFVFRYLEIERALFRKYPEHLRSNNTFCRPLLDSSHELDILRRLYQNPDDRNILIDYSKYTALNLATIRTIGTVEFRSLAGGTDPSIFTSVLETLERLAGGEETGLESSASDILEACVVIDSIKHAVEEPPQNPDEFIHEALQTNPRQLTVEAVASHFER